MKFFTIFLSFFLLCPLVLSAQSADELLQKVSTALSSGQGNQAVSLYRQAISTNVDKSEMYYWTGIDKNSDVCPKIAQELASFYKRKRNYDKAYLFYKELLQRNPNDVNSLVSCAEMEVCRGKEKDALQSYERVLTLDANNLAANIFIGNYYYLIAEQEKRTLEQNYSKIASPTRMQYARYRDELSRVLTTRYVRAKESLLNVVRQFPSTEARKTLDKILLIEKEVNR